MRVKPTFWDAQLLDNIAGGIPETTNIGFALCCLHGGKEGDIGEAGVLERERLPPRHRHYRHRLIWCSRPCKKR